MSSVVWYWGVLPFSVIYFHVLLREGAYLNYPSNCAKRFKQMSYFTHQEWEVPWVLHHWFHPQAVFIRGEGHLWLQGERVGTSSAGTKATVKHSTNSVQWQIYAQVSFLQGGAPSPFDRNYGTKVGVRAIQWLSQKMTENFRQGRVLVSSYTEQTDHSSVSSTSLLSLQTTCLPTHPTRRVCSASAGKSSPSSPSLS